MPRPRPRRRPSSGVAPCSCKYFRNQARQTLSQGDRLRGPYEALCGRSFPPAQLAPCSCKSCGPMGLKIGTQIALFRRSAARDELRRKRNCYGTCPGPSAFVESSALGGAPPNCCPPFSRRRFGCRGPPDKADELAAAHVVGTYPAQRPMPDVLDFPCVNGRIAVGAQHLVALLPQCRCGGEPCVHEHAAHRAVAGAWWRRLRTRSRPRPCTQTNSAQVKRPSSRTQRQAVWCLPGAWVETGHAALPGPGQSRMQPTASRAQTPRKSASEAGGSSPTRPPWPVDPEPAPPAGTTPPANPSKGGAPRRLAAMATEGGTCAVRY